MQKAGEEYPGAMAAVIGLDDTQVEEICVATSATVGEPVVAANYNSLGQVVISGNTDAVEVAMIALKDAGACVVKRIPVSGAFHSPLMQPAYNMLATALDKLEFQSSHIPVYSNYTAMPSADPAILKKNTLNQLLNPVRWTQTLMRMYDDDARIFTECGPGNVLGGLLKRTLSDIESHHVK